MIRQSLDTDVWSVAKLRLVDFLKDKREIATKVPSLRFTEALEIFLRELDQDPRLKPQSKQYRRWCVRKIELSWPGLWTLCLDEITIEDCRAWAARLVKEIACHYYNNSVGTLRQILDCGIRAATARSGTKIQNPALALPLTRVRQKDLRLPEPGEFRDLVANVQKNSGGWGPRAADLTEFLAFSGLRIGSEARWVTWEDVDWQRREMIVRGDPKTGTKNSEVRRVPLIPDLTALLERLGQGRERTGRILETTHCAESLARACRDLGIKRITHHDLRHLFATRCIESGVDIPTVARWLGHRDGGALAMKTYGHLRNEHSQAMAQRVRF